MSLVYSLGGVCVILQYLVNYDNMFSMDSRVGTSIEYFYLINFSDVPEFYSTFSDVMCHFTLASDMSPNSADYVAIFPVGWQSVEDYVCSQQVAVSADLESGSSCTYSVMFPGMCLTHLAMFIYLLCKILTYYGNE